VAIPCDKTSKFSELDGSCHNLAVPAIGRAATPLKRILPAAYEDAKQFPRSLNHQSSPLPTPRRISRELNQDTHEFSIWTQV
jgi:hypothetical protein